MPEYENNHYVQDKLLKNFAVKSPKGKYKLQIIDLKQKKIYFRNTNKAFSKKNLYDVKDADIKKLEKDLNKKVEKPFNKILDRLVSEDLDTFTISRAEVEIIKKYLLIQIYRNYRNSLNYTENRDLSRLILRYNIANNETTVDYWKREMQTILDNPLDDLISKLNLVGVKQNAMEIYNGFLMFVHTCDEFVINDLGYTTERMPVIIKLPFNKYIEQYEIIGKELFGVEGFGNEARRKYKDNSEYIDNYILFPVASDLAVLVVNVLWKAVFLNSIDISKLGIHPSILLKSHFSLPKNEFVNAKIIKSDKDIEKYKTQYDKYIYRIHELNKQETIFVNNLLMNEAYRYVGFKTTESVLPSIEAYILNQIIGVENIKNDYSFVLKKLNI